MPTPVSDLVPVAQSANAGHAFSSGDVQPRGLQRRGGTGD